MSLRVRSEEDPAADVLANGSDHEPRVRPAARRRLRLGIVVIAVACAAVAAGLKVQEQRVAAAEARRLAELWQLSADGPSSFGLEAVAPPSLSAVMDMTFSLRNNGPQDVTVTRASSGEFVLLTPVPLPAHARRDVVLHQQLDCTADTLLPPQPVADRPTYGPLRWPGELQVTATTPRDTDAMTFARPPYDIERAAVTCDRLRSRPEGLGGPATSAPH